MWESNPYLLVLIQDVRGNLLLYDFSEYGLPARLSGLRFRRLVSHVGADVSGTATASFLQVRPDWSTQIYFLYPGSGFEEVKMGTRVKVRSRVFIRNNVFTTMFPGVPSAGFTTDTSVVLLL